MSTLPPWNPEGFWRTRSRRPRRRAARLPALAERAECFFGERDPGPPCIFVGRRRAKMMRRFLRAQEPKP